jgi:hypothetical protein
MSMLDAMQHMVDPSKPQFDRIFLASLDGCMNSVDSNLKASQDAAWRGFVEYAIVPKAGDSWGNDCKNEPNGTCDHYMENNRTFLNINNISIYEPCNFVSNVAYYRAVPTICNHEGWSMQGDMQKALIQSFAALAMGSSFWHGSHTYLGNVCDTHLISVLSFLLHQSTVANLPSTSPILHSLNKTARPPGINSTQQLTNMFRSAPVDSWQATILAVDMPQYMVTFSAIISTWLTLLLPENVVDVAVQLLGEAFGLPQSDADFILKDYLPELRNATSAIKLSSLEKMSLGLKGTGTVMKLVYAFCWQENTFTAPILKKPGVGVLGAELMPSINTAANMLTGFLHTDKNAQSCTNVYPGDAECRVGTPHAKWHEMSANGLTDLAFLADAIHQITKKHLGNAGDAACGTIDGWTDAVKALLW